MIFDENFTIELEAEKNANSQTNTHATLHVMIASNKHTTAQELLFPVTFSSFEGSDHDRNQNFEEKENQTDAKLITTDSDQSKIEWSQSFKNKLKETDSYLLRLLFAFILGILLSLTPCIYPMIPITVGILQSQGTASFLRNFLLSLCYATGLGTTFALMGLIAASSGQAFGYLMANPFFVIGIVTLLCYFAFSLFGFYNLYIPRFLQNKGNTSGSGSAISIFLFGLASGTFASPCLSPGLALILALVATMAHKILGLILLFVFGVGLSMPLIIIGTFSSSLSLLPRAGMWMLEIQKIFGFLLIGMSFYYLSAIVSWSIILIGLALFFFIIGAYYLHKTPKSYLWTFIKNICGAFFIVLSLYIGIQALQEIYYSEPQTLTELNWFFDYQEALQKAQHENKKILIDFSTPYCSICSAITKTVLQNPEISKLLSSDYILLSVDASKNTQEPYKTLSTEFEIQGVPTLIIIDAHNKKELKRWMSELYNMKKTLVIEELKKHAQ